MLPTGTPGNLIEAAPGLLLSGPLLGTGMMLQTVAMVTRRLLRDRFQSLEV